MELKKWLRCDATHKHIKDIITEWCSHLGQEEHAQSKAQSKYKASQGGEPGFVTHNKAIPTPYPKW